MASWQKEWLFVPVLFVLFTSLLCADGLVSRILASRPGVILGRMSYSLYLVHIIGFMIAKRWLPEELPGAIAAILVLVVLTPVFFVLFERPFVRLSKRIVVEMVRRREPAPQPA
jgi:peptidoglycan/LPS O-acetylase OafA/YrhL